MKKLVIALILVLSIIPSSYAQGERLSDYSFVVVPIRFDFQTEAHQYQLNEMLKFLLNKNGFHAFFENELPNVSRCDGVWAEVVGRPGFIWTEVSILLKDCDGILLYESIPGKSKLKDYDKMYTEAMRMAFESVAVLGVRQKKMRMLIDPDSLKEEETPAKKETKEPVSTEANPLNLPAANFTNYTYNNATYILRKTVSDYRFYKESKSLEDGLSYFGKIFVVEGTAFFEDADKNRYLASFDVSGNLTIEMDGREVTYSISK